MTRPRLEPNEVHVWHLLAEQAPHAMRDPRWLALLSDEEAVRLDRYRQPRDRTRSTICCHSTAVVSNTYTSFREPSRSNSA